MSLLTTTTVALCLWFGLPYSIGYFLSRRGFAWPWAVAGALVGAMTGPMLVESYPCCCCLTYWHVMPQALGMSFGLQVDASHSLWWASWFWFPVYAALGAVVDLVLRSMPAEALEDADEPVR